MNCFSFSPATNRSFWIYHAQREILCSFPEISYLRLMTYNEALIYLNRIRDIAIGAPVKGRLIQSLSIGPTDWEQMTDFMNLRIQKGEEAALIEFDRLGKSLSVYGVSVNHEFDVPRWEMTVMDDWELIISN